MTEFPRIYQPQGDQTKSPHAGPAADDCAPYAEGDFVAADASETVETNQVDMSQLLEAWNTATERLRRTHETLREQVRRLSDELHVKNVELARKNRLADLGQIASHVAHEVRNSLMPMTLYTGLLRRRVAGDAESARIVQHIESGLQSLDATVGDLLQFTSQREPRASEVSVSKLLVDVCTGLAPQLAAQHIAADIDCGHDIVVRADADMLRRAVLNLVLNAVDFMPSGGQLVLSGLETDYGVEIEVADSGPGLPGGNAQKVFEPFFTTKSGGTGLGLAIVSRIAEAHGGSISAMNCPEGGAAFTLRIPCNAKGHPGEKVAA